MPEPQVNTPSPKADGAASIDLNLSSAGVSVGGSLSQASQGGSGSGAASASGSNAGKVRMMGRFRLISVLGQGSMGKVIRAEDTSLRRQVALKVLPSSKVRTYRIEQFAREARSAATLEHPNIVHIYEVGQAAGHNYIAMELIEGGDLKTIVKAGGPLDVLRACTVGAEAAEALSYAGQLGIVHRDIKPENLMLTRAGRCKLTDFGLASIDDPTDAFKMPTEAVGTPNYMAPEVIQGSPATGKSDVYSLGAVLYYLLTGTVPFKGDTREATLKAHVKQPAPDIRAVRKDIPDGLAILLWQTMAKSPDQRPDAATLSKALRSYTIAAGGSTSQLMPAASAVTQASPNTKWLLYSLMGGLAAAVIVIGALVYVFYAALSGATSVRVVTVPATPTADVAPAVQQIPAVAAPALARASVPIPAPEPVPAPSPAPIATAATPAPAPAPNATPPVGVPAVMPTQIVHGKTLPALEATDDATINNIMDDTKVYAITGQVLKIEKSPTGKVAILKFKGTKALTAAIFTSNFPAFEKTFGGDCGANLAGKYVRIASEIVSYRGSPEIKDLKPQQVEILQ